MVSRVTQGKSYVFTEQVGGCIDCIAANNPELCRDLYNFEPAGTWGYWSEKESMEAEPTMTDSKQVGGSHYLKAIQPWDIIEAWNLDFWEGNALKYLLRYKEKGGLQDLDKLEHYIQRIRQNYSNNN